MTELDAHLAAVAILLSSAFAACFARRATAVIVGSVGGIAACALGTCAALIGLFRHGELLSRILSTLPMGQVHVGIDSLSSYFLVCIFLVSGLAIIAGMGDTLGLASRSRAVSSVSLLNLLVASMALVVLSRDAVFFLMAWEAMSVSSLLLVYTEHEREDVRRSGLIYLIASHLGVVILFILFVVLSGSSNSFDFAGMATTSRSRVLSDWCFGLALVGFGLKAGFWPMHVWLPEAHPAAPSHVSAVMSGVMLKLGIYGILRASFWLGPPPVEWGITLVVIGATSSLGGVLHALGQTDIKRLLAYSSVENIGIIALALGVGMLGQSESLPVVTYLGYAAALIHGLNHGLMKGLLFHCAGAIAHATRTRNIESLGGLSRQMPVTAAAFLLGAIAISGLPPLNGFIGELLLYFGALHAAAVVPGAGATASLVVVPTLALTGAIACACFVRTYGIIFLGIPRSAATERAHEIGWTTATAMIIGGTLSVAIGLSPMLALSLVNAPVVELVRANVDPAGVVDGIAMAARVTALLVALVIALGCVRKLLFRGRPVSRASTWGCGYDAPTPRMQYTATSFAAPLLAPFDGFYPTRVHRDGPSGYFPTRAHFERRYVDIPADLLFVPAMRRIVRLLGRLHVLQQGHIHTYLVYILAVLIGLLVWVLVLPTALGSP